MTTRSKQREIQTSDILTQVFPKIVEAGWTESQKLSLIAFICRFVDDWYLEQMTSDVLTRIEGLLQQQRTPNQEKTFSEGDGTISFPTKEKESR
mgnify:FL=1|jgi:hypothetical protein|tara:strand:- start:743 stop:1024 length:282 start_codon:yes stop_codon:yes gene_type:complete